MEFKTIPLIDSILITGGTGSFGNAFVDYLLSNTDCQRICIYSRDEYKQAVMRDRYQFPESDRLRFFIGDVRDRDRLSQAMAGVQVVVHAAALKRIEVGQYNPSEMVKTNINGSINVIEAAYTAGVGRVVALSTDKAYKPISPYGQSKALSESLFLAANNVYGGHGPSFFVTRYGNVSGSKGSVIPKWREMQAKGKRIQVTDLDCTRFWMYMQEAVELVDQTIKTEGEGRLVIPDLPAYRLGDLLMAMGIQDFDITGLPEWEKLYECMDDKKCSHTARRMTVEELKEALNNV